MASSQVRVSLRAGAPTGWPADSGWIWNSHVAQGRRGDRGPVGARNHDGATDDELPLSQVSSRDGPGGPDEEAEQGRQVGRVGEHRLEVLRSGESVGQEVTQLARQCGLLRHVDAFDHRDGDRDDDDGEDGDGRRRCGGRRGRRSSRDEQSEAASRFPAWQPHRMTTAWPTRSRPSRTCRDRRNHSCHTAGPKAVPQATTGSRGRAGAREDQLLADALRDPAEVVVCLWISWRVRLQLPAASASPQFRKDS